MPIAVTCNSCKAMFRVKDELEGKRGKCPRCLAVVEVPQLLDIFEEELESPKRPPIQKPRLRKRDILDAFHDDIEPARRTAAYGIGVLFVSIAMIALPAFYTLLVSGIVFLLFYHAVFDAAVIFSTKRAGAIFLFYIGPLVIGVILLLFLVKPLFARRSRKYKLRTLEREEEPVLFGLVACVADAVGAPKPTRIEIDGQVNASASFGSLFGILFGGDLVLTIGLPLAAGLSAEQLAGVIAHELGHFTQGMGMRLCFIVRSINAWFSRIVYEGDDWDEALAKGCEETDFWIGMIFYAALLGVWLTRALFWVFMVIGHTLSCFLLRQMEFDADRYEARLVSAEAFEETLRKLTLLQMASDSAYSLASLSWYKKGRVPDDLSALILHLAAGIPEKEYRKIEKRMNRSQASFFDTHPSNGERLASIQQEDAPGVFHLDGQATQLFMDFDRLSRSVTLRFFRTVIGKRVNGDCLVSVDVFLGGAEPVKKPKQSGDTYDFAS